MDGLSLEALRGCEDHSALMRGGRAAAGDPRLGRLQCFKRLKNETPRIGLGAASVVELAIRICSYGSTGFLAPQFAELSDQEFKRY